MRMMPPDRDGMLSLPPDNPEHSIEEWARAMWFAAYREIYRRERTVYPEWVDIGGGDA
jgi:hypothetical protein